MGKGGRWLVEVFDACGLDVVSRAAELFMSWHCALWRDAIVRGYRIGGDGKDS